MQYIGIDIGTTSICGVLFNVKDGRVEQSLTRVNDTFISSRQPWEKIQDPVAIRDKVLGMFKILSRKAKHLGGIGITGQMHGIVYLDRCGEPVSPLYTWQDGRANLPYKKELTYAGHLQHTTGLPISPGYGFATHFYNTANKCIPAGAKKICTIHDYIAMTLAGKNEPVTDVTDAASFGFFDVRQNRFLSDAISGCGMNTKLLPRITASDEVLGDCDGVPIFPAIGDNQASFLGAVKNITDTLLINVGTGAQVSCYFDRYKRVPDLEIRPFPGGGVIAVGAALCGGKAYALLADFFQKTLRFLGQDDVDVYTAMNGIPYKRLMNESLEVSPLFMGTRINPGLRGTITQIDTNNFTPENLTAGFLKGMANELFYFYTKIENCGKIVNHMTGSGNAIRKTLPLRYILEKRFGMKLSLPAGQEEASIGAALLAAVGTKEFGSIREAGQCLKYVK